MLAGTMASTIVTSQPPDHARSIFVAGIMTQGLGWTIALLMLGMFLSRLMSFGLPSPATRPGMFIAVGPPSFTGLALMALGDAAGPIWPPGYLSSVTDVSEVLRIVSIFVSVFLWLVSVWFFSIATFCCLLVIKKLRFHLTWYSFIFPNVGFTIFTIRIASSLGSQALKITSAVFTAMLVAMWLFVFAMHLRGVIRKEIAWPYKDDDKPQGGFLGEFQHYPPKEYYDAIEKSN
ncbi:hypothetical protein MMC09_003100 [Bachmanniomyces sp. S44760]|nr:hypothetical protein [Bachmanniomyces sp. S44760]